MENNPGKAHCLFCEERITDEYMVVYINEEAAFFHPHCYQAWHQEAEAERNRQKELWEFFG